MSIANERELRSSLYAELNTKHTEELNHIKNSDYQSLLILEINKCVNKFRYNDVQDNEYLKRIFDTLCHDEVFEVRSDYDHAWYDIDNGIFHLTDSQLLKILNDINNEYNILLSSKGML